MATQTPVPSRAAIHALRGLLFTTSCSVAFLAEERRRRLKTVKAAAENARKIHAAKVSRGAPIVDGLQPWEARLRERALEIHESNSNWDTTLSPREVQRGIRRKKKRSTRKENQQVDGSNTSRTAAPSPTVHDRSFRRLAIRPCLSTSSEQLARLRPAHRTFSTRRSDPAERMSPEKFEAIFQEQATSTPPAASKKRSSNARKNTANLPNRNLPSQPEYVDDHTSPEALEAPLRNLTLSTDPAQKPLRRRWHEREAMPARRPTAIIRPAKVSPRAGVRFSANSKPERPVDSSEEVSRFCTNVHRLLSFVEDSEPIYQGEAKAALRRLVFQERCASKLNHLEPDTITLLASTLLTPEWIVTGGAGALDLLGAWEAQHKASDADHDPQLSELCIAREVRQGDWTALLTIDSLDHFVELAPILLRTASSNKRDIVLTAIVDRLIDEGRYSPETRDYTLLEIMAVKEARQGKWDIVLPALTRAVAAHQSIAQTSVTSEEDARLDPMSSASIIAELFVGEQPAARHATFLCELYTIQPFQMLPELMEPALIYFGEQRLLAEYLQWLDFGVSTDVRIDKKFAHILHQSLRHHWNASDAVINKHLRPQLKDVMVREPRARNSSPVDTQGLAKANFQAAQRRDWETVIELYWAGKEKGLPFKLGWLRWAVTALVKLDGPRCTAADDLIIEARNEGHDVSTLEDWLPTYRMKQGWVGFDLYEHTKQMGFPLSQPVYNSAIRDLVEQEEYVTAWKLVYEDAQKNGGGRLAYDEYSLANTLDILIAFDPVKMYPDIKAILDNFSSTRAGWHRNNICRTNLMRHYQTLSWSWEMKNEGRNMGDGGKRYARLLELQELLSIAYDHVKEVRELAEGFDGPGKIVTEASRILKREDLDSEPTAEFPRRRPWFAKSFQEMYMPLPEEEETTPAAGEALTTRGAEVLQVHRAEESLAEEEIDLQQIQSAHEENEAQTEGLPGSSNPSSRFYVPPEQYQRLVATA